MGDDFKPSNNSGIQGVIVKLYYNRLYSELVIDGKTQLSERDKQRVTVV